MAQDLFRGGGAVAAQAASGACLLRDPRTGCLWLAGALRAGSCASSLGFSGSVRYRIDRSILDGPPGATPGAIEPTGGQGRLAGAPGVAASMVAAAGMAGLARLGSWLAGVGYQCGGKAGGALAGDHAGRACIASAIVREPAGGRSAPVVPGVGGLPVRRSRLCGSLSRTPGRGGAARAPGDMGHGVHGIPSPARSERRVVPLKKEKPRFPAAFSCRRAARIRPASPSPLRRRSLPAPSRCLRRQPGGPPPPLRRRPSSGRRRRSRWCPARRPGRAGSPRTRSC